MHHAPLPMKNSRCLLPWLTLLRVSHRLLIHPNPNATVSRGNNGQCKGNISLYINPMSTIDCSASKTQPRYAHLDHSVVVLLTNFISSRGVHKNNIRHWYVSEVMDAIEQSRKQFHYGEFVVETSSQKEPLAGNNQSWSLAFQFYTSEPTKHSWNGQEMSKQWRASCCNISKNVDRDVTGMVW